MGAGASSEASFQQMLACTMLLGEAMVQGLDPRFVRFPDMYRVYDFHVGPTKRPAPRGFQQGNMVLLVHSPDEDGKFQTISLGGDDSDEESEGIVAAAGAKHEGEDEDGLPSESTAAHVVVFVDGDKVVLDRATLHEPNNDGWTPLHACCHVLNAQEAGITILKELLAAKADLNIATKRGPGSFSCGWTPLHIASAYGLEALAIKLARAPGVDVNTRNSVGWTPLYDACHRGYASVARELLRAGARADVVCPEFALCPYPGQRSLAEAARQGHIECVRALLDWGVDKNAVNALGWSALHEAAYHSRVAVVQLLIVYGADVSLRTDRGSLARDLTIHSEIRGVLDELSAASAASPSASVSTSASSPSTPASASSTSPKKSPGKSTAPLSRKEEYALLGDLPSLDVPSITIRVGDELEGGDDDKDEEKDVDAAEAKPRSRARRKKPRGRDRRRADDAPAEFKCAVSLKLLREPMRSPLGHVFEREVIEAWFRDFGNRCPLSGEPLSLAQLTRDDTLRDEIRAWRKGGGVGAGGAAGDGDGAAPEAVEGEPATATAEPSAELKADDLYDF